MANSMSTLTQKHHSRRRNYKINPVKVNHPGQERKEGVWKKKRCHLQHSQKTFHQCLLWLLHPLARQLKAFQSHWILFFLCPFSGIGKMSFGFLFLCSFYSLFILTVCVMVSDKEAGITCPAS